MKALTATVFLCASFGLGAAQASTASSTTSSSAPGSTQAATTARRAATGGRSECAVAVGLCVTVPTTWKRMGDIFNDLGFVVSEVHPGIDPAAWPQLTVAAIDVASAKSKSGAASGGPSLDALIDMVLTPDRSFTAAETLQRTHLILNGGDAEMVRVRLHDNSGKREAIEAIALIEGEDGLVYSIALRCAGEDFARLEPVFQRAAHSWRIKQAPAAPAKSSQPKQDLEKK